MKKVNEIRKYFLLNMWRIGSRRVTKIKNFGEKQVIQKLHVIVTTWKTAREYEYNDKQIALLSYSASHSIPDRSNSGLQSNFCCFDFRQFLSYNSCFQNANFEKDNQLSDCQRGDLGLVSKC